MRETTEAIVGAVTGSFALPSSLLLGRYDDHGRLQYTGRTTTLAQAASSAVAELLAPARRGHPWTGWSSSAPFRYGMQGQTPEVLRERLPPSRPPAPSSGGRRRTALVLECRDSGRTRRSPVGRPASPDRKNLYVRTIGRG
ncbi:hypothetical protein AB0L10_41195 [Streptomyces flaveolus]|uniref:hypothetical protein n=1 Tax=Streptomyces flaveolus TaxID=67297 RepID=UPI00341B864B